MINFPNLSYPLDDHRYISVLTIAGSDPSGGAGLQADLKTFSSLQCYGMSVVTALTAQNTQGVQGLHSLPATFVREQLNSIFNDIYQIDAIKIGMLEREEIIDEVAEFLRQRKTLPMIVVDPVMFAKSRDQIINDKAIVNSKDKILPLATILTPNIQEACRLLERENTNDIQEIAFQLLKLGPKAVLIKGSDGCDCLAIESETTPIWIGEKSDWTETKNVHGSGCTFAAAITSFLAHGESLIGAVQKAKLYISNAIRQGAEYKLGHGNGPVYHNLVTFNFIQDAWFSISDLYKQIKQLPFLLKLADGTLPFNKFEFFINQDYLFILDRGQICAKLASLTSSDELKSVFMSIAETIRVGAEEIFIKYHVTKEPSILSNKSPVCTAYTEFLKQAADSNELAGLVALIPCSLIYQKIGEYLKSIQKSSVNPNPYYQIWIDTYSSQGRRERVEQLLSIVNRAVLICSRNEIIILKDIFKKASQFEYDFWDDAYQTPT
jgi:hydroxymethylpyrimidine kinase/phosphomethylpyrimidine kinase